MIRVERLHLNGVVEMRGDRVGGRAESKVHRQIVAAEKHRADAIESVVEAAARLSHRLLHQRELGRREFVGLDPTEGPEIELEIRKGS